jgi:hypothetical protein
MKKTVAQVGIALGIFLAVAVVVLLVNQTAQIVFLLDRVHPVLGSVALWGLILVYAACLAVPLVLLLRFPAPLLPPDTEDEASIDRHRERLRERLRMNPLLEGTPMREADDLDAGLEALDGHAHRVIHRTSSRVFLSTAVSQYGSLSALLVLAAQAKMVWDVAHVYHHRPALRQLLALYTNVAATAFVAGRIEDVDVAEHLEPVISSALGSVVGAVPGFQAASELVVNAVFVGSTNAFLTLRVGVVTKRYCGAVVRPEREGLWKSATVEAAGMLRGIVSDGAKRVSGAFVTASGRAIGGAVKGIGSRVRSTGSSVASRMRFRGGDPTQENEAPPTPDVEPEGAT